MPLVVHHLLSIFGSQTETFLSFRRSRFVVAEMLSCPEQINAGQDAPCRRLGHIPRQEAQISCRRQTSRFLIGHFSHFLDYESIDFVLVRAGDVLAAHASGGVSGFQLEGNVSPMLHQIEIIESAEKAGFRLVTGTEGIRQVHVLHVVNLLQEKIGPVDAVIQCKPQAACRTVSGSGVVADKSGGGDAVGAASVVGQVIAGH